MAKKVRRLVRIEVEGFVPDSECLADHVVSILRRHADDIENQEHIAGKEAEGEYTMTEGRPPGQVVKLRWKASYPDEE